MSLHLARSGYSVYVAENWRVRVILAGRGATKFRQSFRVVLLESGLGDDTTISDDYKSSVFIYTTTSEAAEKAEHLALQALAQRERRGDCRLEQWDSLLKEWRDVRSGQPAAEKATAGPTTVDKVAGGVVNTVVGAVIETLLGGP